MEVGGGFDFNISGVSKMALFGFSLGCTIQFHEGKMVLEICFK